MNGKCTATCEAKLQTKSFRALGGDVMEPLYLTNIKQGCYQWMLGI
jgi:hypothetical protein